MAAHVWKLLALRNRSRICGTDCERSSSLLPGTNAEFRAGESVAKHVLSVCDEHLAVAYQGSGVKKRGVVRFPVELQVPLFGL